MQSLDFFRCRIDSMIDLRDLPGVIHLAFSLEAHHNRS